MNRVSLKCTNQWYHRWRHVDAFFRRHAGIGAGEKTGDRLEFLVSMYKFLDRAYAFKTSKLAVSAASDLIRYLWTGGFIRTSQEWRAIESELGVSFQPKRGETVQFPNPDE